jgi:hypothetical protein
MTMTGIRASSEMMATSAAEHRCRAAPKVDAISLALH